jgi:type II secretory pathway component PulF
VAHSGMRSRSWREAPPSPMGLLWLRFKTGLPVLRTRERHRGLARAARTLGMLLEAGLTLPEACREIAVPELAGPYADAFHGLGQAARRGDPFESALRQSGLPDSFVALAAAGAVGGELPAALYTVADWHAARAERLDHRLAFAVPCITIPLAGLLVGAFQVYVFSGIAALQSQMLMGR